MVGQLLLGLSILVVLHEAGHYFAARAFGIRVEKFYLFFDAWGVSLVKFKYKGTEYGIGWLPLGGYVKIAGMVDESLDTAQLATEPKPDEFRSKPAWQRLIVMLGGVIVNAVLGFLIFSAVLLVYGEKYIPNNSLTNGVAPLDLGKEMGIKPGDKLVSLNGKPIERYDEIFDSEVILGDGGVLTVSREGQIIPIEIPKDFAARVAKDEASAMFVTPRFTFTVGGVEPGFPAAKAGLKVGDSLLTVAGQPIRFFDELQAVLGNNKEKPVALEVMRAGKMQTLQAEVTPDGKLGLTPDLNEPPKASKRYNLGQSIPAGASMATSTVVDYAKSLGKIFSGDVPVRQSLGGPIMIANKLYGGTWDWYRFWYITGLLSMILAVMNLLPIPALDGGHVVFTLAEMLRGKPLPESFLTKAQYAGMILLLGLMLFIFGNDIFRLLGF